jgi:hypothetical protein
MSDVVKANGEDAALMVDLCVKALSQTGLRNLPRLRRAASTRMT